MTLPPVARSSFRCGGGARPGEADLDNGGVDGDAGDPGPRDGGVILSKPQEPEPVSPAERERILKAQAAAPIEPGLKGFLMSALRRQMRSAPLSQWDEIAGRFFSATSSLDARQALADARAAVEANGRGKRVTKSS